MLFSLLYSFSSRAILFSLSAEEKPGWNEDPGKTEEEVPELAANGLVRDESVAGLRADQRGRARDHIQKSVMMK